METTNGRELIQHILNQCFMDVDTFDADPYKHARNAGARNVGVWLTNELITAAQGSYLKMKEECLNE
jgi:hypothetical protein